jgi:hypothetical protein
MNTKSKILSLKEAEKVNGLYEVVNTNGVYGYRLLAKLKDEQAMQREQMKAIAERLMIMLIVP